MNQTLGAQSIEGTRTRLITRTQTQFIAGTKIGLMID
jgi:hypothetical protein